MHIGLIYILVTHREKITTTIQIFGLKSVDWLQSNKGISAFKTTENDLFNFVQ